MFSDYNPSTARGPAPAAPGRALARLPCGRMSYFAVTRERGPTWDARRLMREQDGWDAHARFMDDLTADGFVVLGGPLGDGTRLLLIINAEGPPEIEARLAEDPWTHTDQLRIAKIEPWEILLERSTDGLEA